MDNFGKLKLIHYSNRVTETCLYIKKIVKNFRFIIGDSSIKVVGGVTAYQAYDR